MYKKCPRCCLNYIKDGEELCSVCVKELRGIIDKSYCYVCGRELSWDEDEICRECRKESGAEADD